MSAYQRAPSRSFLVAITRPACAVALALVLGACSSAKQPAGPQVFAWLAPEPTPPAQVNFNPSEVEAERLPAQTPQPVSVRNMPDDPAAPWNPNYGRSAAGAWSTSLVGPACLTTRACLIRNPRKRRGSVPSVRAGSACSEALASLRVMPADG
jgi:hypothetical protein